MRKPAEMGRDTRVADEGGRSRLGRGLATLMGDMGPETAKTPDRNRGQRRAPVEHLRRNPRNPRQVFADAELDALTASIKQRGIIQPIVVRSLPNMPDLFEIVAGERRWRAAQRAGLHDVPIVVLDLSDGDSLELAIVENVQRADLNPLEEAQGYQALADQFGYDQEKIAKSVGKSRSHVANTLRLLKLPDAVKAYVNEGKLSAGHARALIGQPDADALARDVVERGLNVRQIEALIQERSAEPSKPAGQSRTRTAASKDADTLALQKRLSDALGLTVTIEARGDAGTLQIGYRTLDQLDDVIRRIGG